MILSIQDPDPVLLGGPLVHGQPHVWSDDPLDTRSRSHILQKTLLIQGLKQRYGDPLDTRSISSVKIRDPLDIRSRSHILQKTLSIQGLK